MESIKGLHIGDQYLMEQKASIRGDYIQAYDCLEEDIWSTFSEMFRDRKEVTLNFYDKENYKGSKKVIIEEASTMPIEVTFKIVE